jgi:glutamate-1-semialdehyde 2,1-aminomutase
MTILGKIIGGGFPIGAFCASAEIMGRIDQRKYPKAEERVAHGGTFTGNPVSMVAGCTTLDILRDGKVYIDIDRLWQQDERVGGDIRRRKLPATVTGVSSHCNPLPGKCLGTRRHRPERRGCDAYFTHAGSGIIYGWTSATAG